jgi:hypothetical protein
MVTVLEYCTEKNYSSCYSKKLGNKSNINAVTASRLLAVSLARQCQLLPDDSAGVYTPAGLAGIWPYNALDFI